jgi:hypothetical protein
MYGETTQEALRQGTVMTRNVSACFVLLKRFGQLRLLRGFLVVPLQGPSHNHMDKIRKQARDLESLEVLGASSMRADDVL